MKLPIRYFSIGILTATIVVALTLYFFDNTSSDLENESLDSIISFLEDDGYRVVSEDEYISLSVGDSSNNQVENKTESNNNSSEDQKDPANENEDNDDNEESSEDTNNESKKSSDEDQSENEDANTNTNEESVNTYTLEVKPDMLSPEVSQLLVDNEIIDDAEAFTAYLEDEDYSKYIQLGEHDVSSSMSFNELAEEITSN